MMEALAKELGGRATWTHPEGGFFVWVNLPEGVSGDAFAKYLIDEKKLTTISGSAYRPDGQDVNAIRLNFSVPLVEEIGARVALLREGLDEFIQK